jgi:hypothetical protein
MDFNEVNTDARKRIDYAPGFFCCVYGNLKFRKLSATI